MTQYVRLTKGVQDKGILLPVEEMESKDVDPNTDWYTSICYYTEEQFQNFQKTGTIAGIDDVKTDKLVFDFDSNGEIEKARTDALELVNRSVFYNIKPDNFEYYFSGNKGFTLVLNLDKLISPKEAKHIAMQTLGKGLDTLDPTLYNASRILRIPGTKHPKSGLFKIPLSYTEFKTETLTSILGRAKDMILTGGYTTTQVQPSEAFFKTNIKEATKSQAYGFDLSTIDMKTRPSYLTKARWLLMNGFFKEGQRSTALLCLASTLKNVGYDKEIVYRMLKGTAEVQAKRTNTERFSDSELYNNVIEQVYGPHWKGGQFSERDENSWLFQYANEMGVNEVERIDRPMTIGEVEAGFTDFVRNIDANTIKTGIWELDQALPITVGMNLGVIAAPGAGKTALALEILRNTSQAGVVSVFASLDMHRTRLFEKLLYKVSGGMERKDLYKMFQDGKGGDLTKKIKEQYGNVYFFDRSAATVEKIRDYVLDVERESGKKVKLVMIDYFERVLSDMSDETAASKNISGQVQDMVNDLNVCGITLVQPNKQSLYGGPDAPILSYTAIKGSSFLYQSFRSIISLWRPFMSPENKHNNKYMQMAILKNDLGELDMFDFKWTGKTGSIEHLEDNEHAAFIELLKEKDRKKNEKEGW